MPTLFCFRRSSSYFINKMSQRYANTQKETLIRILFQLNNVFLRKKTIKMQEFPKQPTVRQESITALKGYLSNPGKFSILLLGERGTGKTHWLECICQEIDIKSKIITEKAVFVEATREYWTQKFDAANEGYLIIDDVEKLSLLNQELLLDALSTHNGMYGFGEKRYNIRIVFVSSFDITLLRDTEQYLLHTFFDRIAQLVTKLPSFKDSDRNIYEDFKYIWEKMKFDEKSKMPSEKLQIWLEKKSSHLHGNFRDLHKIAINWHQQQLNGIIDEDKILDKIKIDFDKFYHYPEQKTELHDTFNFTRGKNKDTIEREWRAKFKEWAKNEYGTLQKAAKALEMSYRTFEKW
jgi:transcriptional regulator with AAA-type ATPase domain